MIRFHLLFIFNAVIVLLQPFAGGDDNHLMKPQESSFTTSSCLDRCHVNYMAYRNLYHGEVFKHKTHSPDQEIECSLCHNNDAVNTKTHGGLVIQDKDCSGCHHKKAGDRDCLKCHTDVKGYMDGAMQNFIVKISDWMSASVSCSDCHKLGLDGYSFSAVRERCTECHNADYGLLYDAWKETLDNKIKQFCESNAATTNMRNRLRLVQSYGMHNFRLSQILLRSIEQNHD